MYYKHVLPIIQVYIYLIESGQKVELGSVSSDVATVGPSSFSREDIAAKTRNFIVRYVYFISNNRVVRAREDNMLDTKVRFVSLVNLICLFDHFCQVCFSSSGNWLYVSGFYP